ncbi:MAG: glycerol-3-phosphate acyltransferase [Candidatus Riflebacteria bacterium]|nr:glycerol-3-phosphate acyltransferase [Candidatus Riflebacteria bacterium]
MTNSILYFASTYLVGSIPTGYIASKLLKKEDFFKPGERTARRAGDVFNLLGRKIGLLVTFLDVVKGWIAVSLLINLLIGAEGHETWWIVSLGGLFVVLGHCHSVWIGFRGGRGLSVAAGVLLTLLPVPTILACIVWGVLSFWGLSTRPGAVSAACANPLFSIAWIWWYQSDKLFYLYVVAFLSLWILYGYRSDLKGYLGMNVVLPDIQNPPVNNDPENKTKSEAQNSTQKPS